MNAFNRQHAQVDIPTLSLVPADDAERAEWERKRQAHENARRIRREEDAQRMENLRRYEAEMARPHRRLITWLERQWRALKRS